MDLSKIKSLEQNLWIIGKESDLLKEREGSLGILGSNRC